MPTTPPTLPNPPSAPQRGVKATFFTLMDAFLKWIENNVTQFNALATNVKTNADEAFQSASTASTAATTATDAAAAAVATANATLWVSGATVQQRANVISPLTHLTYRRKTATGSGTTDPSLDAANYVPLSSALVQMFTSADQTFTASGSLTIAHGLGALPKFVMFFGRDTANGRIYQLATVTTRSSSADLGGNVSYDASNVYIAWSVNPPAVPNGVYFVKAFI